LPGVRPVRVKKIGGTGLLPYPGFSIRLIRV
jgi:hypothetical protein